VWAAAANYRPMVEALTAAVREAAVDATATLPEGQITVQGVVVNRSLNVTLPITGGSGQFQGAGGQLVQRDVSSGGQIRAELTFRLED
jgi:Allene oxide cyclase barrel like domain